MKRIKLLTATLACAWWAMLGAQAVKIEVSSDIAEDTRWYRTNTYQLNTAIFVTNGATLTIESGTLIQGVKDGTVQIGTNPPAPGTLIISRGSKIRAMGTAAQPIVMSNTNDNHFVGPSPVSGTTPWNNQNNQIGRTWGGLILLGRTYLAYQDATPTGTRYVQIEGLQPYGQASEYGGGDDDDDSGELHYVSIRYGGYVLGTANEINGLTLGAVGRGTTIEHVEVFQNKDDGFEWFGGTVNTKYLVSWNNADDSFDWDEGFRGKGQFWLAVQGPLTQAGGSDASDKGAECDGANKSDSAQPASCPTIYNATFVGTGRISSNLPNTAMHLRDSSAGRFYNSMFLDFGGACGLIEGEVGGAADSASYTASNYYNSSYYDHPTGGRMLELRKNVFWNINSNYFVGCPAGAAPGAVAYFPDSAGDATKAHFAYPVFTETALSNAYIAEPANSDYPYGDATNLPIRDLIRASHEVYGSGVSQQVVSVTYWPVESIDPRPATNTPYIDSGLMPPADGFFTPISSIGAFGSRNWANWTLAARQGTLAAPGAVDGDYSEFDEFPEVTNSYMSYTVQFPTANGQTYDLQWAPAVTGTWQTLTSVSGDGGTISYTDARPMIRERYYRLATTITP